VVDIDAPALGDDLRGFVRDFGMAAFPAGDIKRQSQVHFLRFS
jgi:hypothetical protein